MHNTLLGDDCKLVYDVWCLMKNILTEISNKLPKIPQSWPFQGSLCARKEAVTSSGSHPKQQQFQTSQWVSSIFAVG